MAAEAVKFEEIAKRLSDFEDWGNVRDWIVDEMNLVMRELEWIPMMQALNAMDTTNVKAMLFTAGMDNVDDDGQDLQGIIISEAPDLLKAETATPDRMSGDDVLLYMLSIEKRIHAFLQYCDAKCTVEEFTRYMHRHEFRVRDVFTKLMDVRVGWFDMCSLNDVRINRILGDAAKGSFTQQMIEEIEDILFHTEVKAFFDNLLEHDPDNKMAMAFLFAFKSKDRNSIHKSIMRSNKHLSTLLFSDTIRADEADDSDELFFRVVEAARGTRSRIASFLKGCDSAIAETEFLSQLTTGDKRFHPIKT